MTLIKRSIYIIIYYIAVGTFTTLSFSALLTSYANTQTLQNGLTQESIYFSIQAEHAPSVKVNQLLDELKKQSSSFLLYKDEGNSYAKSIYLHNYIFPMMTSSERQITSIPPGNVILDKSLLNNTVIHENDLFFLYNGKYYKVKDSFIWINKYINIDSKFFVALEQDQISSGQYSVDGINLTKLEVALNELNQKTSISYSIIPATQSYTERIRLALQDQAFIVIVFAVSLLLMLLSIFGTTVSWIQSRRDELRTRHLVGATASDLRKWLLKEYWPLLLFSFTIGCVLAWVIAKMEIFNAIIKEVSVWGSLLSFLFCLIIGTLTAIISIYRYGYKNRKSELEEALLP
ncbi:ABC transporter permease [Paenibacillus xylanivorans]|uniref:ABC3 transporter permease C-terminal domain-containing protein n=1 Tax=Paenibacillus xylanivorans TaxID=1705561 RepID=A0A0M9BMA7_9BACL|nr:FtsX-like permease family protein [Paenibacillus xylanivorans]KOY14202.1 hypothetical protein AMS66_22670 [Paenibacillus xylanivorans]